MDRGAWWATVHGVAKVGHNLATKRKAKLSFVRIQEQKLSKINLQNKNGLNKYVLNSLPVWPSPSSPWLSKASRTSLCLAPCVPAVEAPLILQKAQALSPGSSISWIFCLESFFSSLFFGLSTDLPSPEVNLPVNIAPHPPNHSFILISFIILFIYFVSLAISILFFIFSVGT